VARRQTRPLRVKVSMPHGWRATPRRWPPASPEPACASDSRALSNAYLSVRTGRFASHRTSWPTLTWAGAPGARPERSRFHRNPSRRGRRPRAHSLPARPGPGRSSQAHPRSLAAVRGAA